MHNIKLPKEKQDLLTEIKLLFGLNEDPRDLLNKLFDTTTNEPNEVEELQSALGDFILNDQFLKKYPPKRSYQVKFLKSIIKIFEANNWELGEDIFSIYISLINESEKHEEKHFLVFFSKDDISQRPVVVEQNSNVISNGTTGLHVWPACFSMIEYIEARKETFLNRKNVIELGSGIGLLGLTLLKFDNLINSYTFTDSNHLVLKQIERNYSINRELATNGDSTSKQPTVSIHEFDWTNPNEMRAFDDDINRHLDLILATDIVYDPDLFEPLVNSLDFVWSKQLDENRRRDLALYIASTIRNEETYGKFLETIDRFGFKHQIVESKLGASNCIIEILKIFK